MAITSFSGIIFVVSLVMAMFVPVAEKGWLEYVQNVDPYIALTLAKVLDRYSAVGPNPYCHILCHRLRGGTLISGTIA